MKYVLKLNTKLSLYPLYCANATEFIGVKLQFLAIMLKCPQGYTGVGEYETTASTRKNVEAVVSC